ncbi:MAG: rRNA maturation RNase YbeY [Myxococcota bacterium]|nr:rRNA maturation RNase YbeY [Myxococcota bacterium]
MAQSVSVSVRGVRGRCDPRTIRRRATQLLTLVGRPEAELSVVLCDDDFIAGLNQAYRAKSGATDVLSFAMAEGEDGDFAGETLGDVVISIDTAARQALELGHSLLDEVTSLLVHGVLHLLGYDHIKPEDSRKMFAQARELEKKMRTRTETARKNYAPGSQ